MHGTSFLHTFANPAAQERHTQQYFEIYGYRAMYKDGWWLAQGISRVPWDASPASVAPFAPGVWRPEDDPVELYYLPDDFSQANDVAAANPDKVAELQELFWQEAEKFKVLPMLAGLSFYFGMTPPLPAQTKYTYYGDIQNVASGMIPRIYNHSYAITADLHVPDTGAEGVIVAEADHLGGFALFVEDGKLRHTYSMMGIEVFRHVSDAPLPTGAVTVRLEFQADEAKPATGGDIRMFANGTEIGKGRMDHSVPFRFSGYAGMDIGRDNGGVVDRGYADRAPFAFTGTINKVVFDIQPHLSGDDEHSLHESAHHGHVAHGISE